MLSITLMLVITPIASSAAIPNQDTMTYATIGGPDASGGSDPAWAYDTGSSLMLMQTYEPLFMYNTTSLTTFVPMLADWWPGYTGDGYSIGGFITPYNDNAANKAYISSTYGITVPDWANQTWIFHIRTGAKWQNESYGTVQPHDVVYSFQRGLLQDAISTVQWMIYGPLLGQGGSAYWFNRTGANEWYYNGTTGLGYYVRTAIEGNDGTGYVAFNLISPYVPFMQILTQSWSFILNKQWCIERGCIDTGIALSNNPNNFTEFLAHYAPELSPLMEPSVVGSAWPMMGSGPYQIIVYNTDPHTGQQYYQKFDDYWGHWPGDVGYHGSAGGFCKYVRIKIVEEWSNRKFQFLSTGSTQVDLTDVPRANCAELHVSGKDSATLPGLNLTKVLQQLADYYYFNYQVGEGSAFFPTWTNGTQVPTLFSDRDLREAMMYCFNDSQFLTQYFLGEANQPTTYMCAGTAYYNTSLPVRQYNLDQAVAHFKLAWGGQVWSQGITVKLVYNIGNLARQTIATMISDTVARINDLYGTNLNIVADGEPWATYLPAMQHHQLSCFTVGWIADYPDPDDWAGPFMDPLYGAYAHAGQKITYGLNTTSLNAAYNSAVPKLTWGPIPYTNLYGNLVTGLNNTYVRSLIAVGPSETPANREKLYNELSDIFYAEAGAMPTDQGVGRHYERDWVHGWVGEYSNNAVAPGDYFYQMWKAPVGGAVVSVDMSAAATITNTTYVYPIILDNMTGSMVDRHNPAVAVYVNYTLHVKYVDLTGPTIYATIVLYRSDIWPASSTPSFYAYKEFVVSLGPGDDYTIEDLPWAEDGTMTNGIWKIGLNTDPVGTAGGHSVVDSDPTNNAINSTYAVKILPFNLTMSGLYQVGDLGSRVPAPPKFFAFDGVCDGGDLALFLLCYHKDPRSDSAAWYLGDLGSRVPAPPKWFAYDGKCDGGDLALFLLAYHKDPSVPNPQ